MVRGEEGPRRPDADETIRPEVDHGDDTRGDRAAAARAPGVPRVPGHDVEALVGRGGFATVWRAHQRSVGRTVAVKVLDHRVLDDEALARFRLEVATLAELSWNPNTVHVYDVGTTDDGRPFVSMEWMAGGSLAARVAEAGPLSPDQVVRVGLALTDAVQAAHDSGVLHRDVKPENVLVSQRGDAKLADFGVARLAGTTTSIAGGAFRGTVLHAAPELLDGSEPSYASDVWGIGSTLYFLCAGVAPFAGAGAGADSVTGIIRRTLLDEPAALPDHVPPALASVILECLAKDPSDRPASVEQLRLRLAAIDPTDLTGAAAAGETGATGGVAPDRKPEADGSTARRAVMVGAAAAVVLAVVGWSLGVGRSGPDDAEVAVATETTSVEVERESEPADAGPDGENTPTEDTRIPSLPTREGVTGLSGRPDAEDRSPQLHAALDRFAATTTLPGAANAIGSTDIPPATLDFTEVPSVFDYVASNARGTSQCRRVLLPRVHLDGVAARIWSDGTQIVVVNTAQLGSEVDARRYFAASALNFGLERQHCDGWPADGVATHTDVERLRIDRMDFPVDPSVAPDQIVTTVTSGDVVGGVAIDRSYQLVAQFGDRIVIALVGSLAVESPASAEDGATLIDDLARAIAG